MSNPIRQAAKWRLARPPWAAALVCLLTIAGGCDRLDMYDQPRYEPLEPTNFFRDGLSARPLPEGTVARGELREDEAFYTGKVHDRLVSQIPEAAYRAVYDRAPARFKQPYEDVDASELRLALLERGRARFDIYCSVCHGATGSGDGMIVRRGFRKPPSYHVDRLKSAPSGHFFDVMTNGFGAMASYASRVEVADRWAIVAYIRALQLSQSAELEDVPAGQRAALMQTTANNADISAAIQVDAERGATPSQQDANAGEVSNAANARQAQEETR